MLRLTVLELVDCEGLLVLRFTCLVLELVDCWGEYWLVFLEFEKKNARRAIEYK